MNIFNIPTPVQEVHEVEVPKVEVNNKVTSNEEILNKETSNEETSKNEDLNNSNIFEPLAVEETPKENNNKDIISIKGLSHTFNPGTSNEYKIFDNFNITISDIENEGQCYTIMGGSGCGKTQILKLIAGISSLPESESSKVKIYNKTLKEYGNIPMVFQNYSNYEWYTVLKNVMLPMLCRGVPKKEAEEKAMNLLKLVGLEDKANSYPIEGEMSGGQLQRVAIARSLACDKSIILFDEATSGLDPYMKSEIQNLILKIFYESKYDPTIINVSHSIEEAIYISNRIIILKKNPCSIYKTIDVHYSGESKEHPRGEWVKQTQEYSEYYKLINQYLSEAQ